jgi:predicted O-methyltransferase YrrM
MAHFLSPEICSLLAQLEEQGRVHDARETEHARKFLNLEPETAKLVSILARSSRARSVLEIGTSNGYSTIWLAASIGPLGGRVISIDRSSEKKMMAQENVSRAGLQEYVDLRCGDATELLTSLSGRFDLVFFDADRRSAPAQLAILLPKLAPAALLLADNALSHPQEMAAYVAMVEGLEQFQHVIVPIGKGLSVAFRSEAELPKPREL